VTATDGRTVYWEVKGYMDAKSITRMRRMSKFYPEQTVIMIDAKSYRTLAKRLAGLVPGWE
jgi:hypothetical protein